MSTDQIFTERRVGRLWMWGIMVFATGGASCAAVCPISNGTNAFAVVSLQTDSNDFVTLSFESCTNYVYIVQAESALAPTSSWTDVAWMWGTDEATSWDDTNASMYSSRFYQVVRSNPNTLNNGIPYGWAVTYGLDPFDPNLVTEDPEGTGFNNWEEYLMGFDPTNPLSYPGCITNGFSNATNLIYVATNGSDTNSGTAAAPFLTIQMAATTAKAESQSGVGSTIIVMPGTYGESIAYSATSASLVAPVVFSAATNGTVVISGVDVWTNGWTLVAGSTNVYEHSWTNTWGLAPIPSGWSGVLTNPIVRRSEIVLVNGDLYTQVLSLGAMKNGSYFVDDATNHLLYVQHRAGVVASNAFYEVSQRTNLLTVTQSGSFQVANVALQGLEFRGGATPVPNSAVEFGSASNVLVNTCTFDWNNWCGMNFDFGRSITIRGCVANHNGAMGLQAGNHEKNIVSDGNQTDFNNWRGSLGGFLGFSIAGMKALNIHTGLFRNQVAIANQTYGLWFDYDNENVFVEGGVFSGNSKDGLQLEATEGPAQIQGVVSSRGQGSFGLLCQNAEQMTVTNCAFIASGTSVGSGDIGCSVSTSRAVTNWETGTGYTLYSSNWSLHNLATSCAGSVQYGLYMLANFPGFLSTLSSDYNDWYNTGSNPLFYIGGTNYSLSGWQSLSGQDAHSSNASLQVTFTPTQDTYLNLGTTTNTYGSATNAICDTQTNGTGMADVILLEFDLSSLTSTPRQAELQLAVPASSVVNGPVIFYVYPLTTAWDEDATTAEAEPDSSVSWAAGTFSAADYNPQAAGVEMTGTASGLNTFVDITALVQSWVSGVLPNYGVVVIAQPIWNQPVADGSNLQRFTIGTREAASAQRPQISCISR